MRPRELEGEGVMVPMRVERVGMDPWGKFLVVLTDEQDRQRLPIWIGLSEATSIALALNGEEPERPLSHDLLRNVLLCLGQSLTRVEVTKLEASTYFASLYLDEDGHERLIDSRPSDAIALALRAGAPIFVAEDVLTEAAVVVEDQPEEPSEEQQERFRQLMSQIPPVEPED